jgi:hypothetical protein
MRFSPRTILIVLIAAAAACATARAQDQFTLKYALEKGKAYRFADTSLIKSSQEINGQEMKSTVTSYSTVRLVPEEIRRDGATVFIISPDRMTVTVKNARMDTTIDIKEMVGKRTRMTVSALGETLKKEIVDTVQLTPLTAQMGRQDLIRLHTMPAKPVAIGEKWTSTRPDTNDAMGGRMVTVSTGDFTLVARENKLGVDCLKISYTGKLTVRGKGTMSGMDFFVEGSGTTAGTYYQAVKSGVTVWEDSKYDVESTVALTGPQNMTIPSSTSVSTHRILLKD